MADLLEYKCPCCGGKLEFNSDVQQMKCPYCDSEFSIEAMQEHDAAINEGSSEEMSWDTPQEACTDMKQMQTEVSGTRPETGRYPQWTGLL